MQRARFDALTEKLMKKLHCGREEVLLLALEAFATGTAGAKVVSTPRRSPPQREHPDRDLFRNCRRRQALLPARLVGP